RFLRARTSTLFPSTTLFRSLLLGPVGDQLDAERPLLLLGLPAGLLDLLGDLGAHLVPDPAPLRRGHRLEVELAVLDLDERAVDLDRKSTRLNSSHVKISYAV